MSTLLKHFNNFFTRLPLPLTAIQFSRRYISGIHLFPKDKKIRSHFIQPLEDGVLAPSFFKKNIHDPERLRQAFKAGVEKLNCSEHKMIFLLPELSQNIFIIPFDSLPVRGEEREEFIRFKIKKQMPLLPDDNRLAYDIVQQDSRKGIIAAMARASIIREYEDFFSSSHFKVRMVGIPSICLLNMLDKSKQDDFVLIDIEEDSFSLTAVIGAKVVMYRQKPLSVKGDGAIVLEQKIENISQEIFNTANYIEDREKRKITSFWIRMGILGLDENLFNRLEEKLRLPLHRIETALPGKLTSRENKILAPLMGQIK